MPPWQEGGLLQQLLINLIRVCCQIQNFRLDEWYFSIESCRALHFSHRAITTLLARADEVIE